MNHIWSIIDKHEPVLEMEVRQYIESVVESALKEGSDEDVGRILSSFLSEEESFDIISAMHVQKIAREIESTSIKSNDMPPRLHSEELHTLTSAPETSFTPPTVDYFQKLYSSEPTEASRSKPTSKSHRKERAGRTKNKINVCPNTELVNDDHASAWTICQQSNRNWGGRGHGGRGVRLSGNNFECIHLPSVSLSYEGNELLVDSTMDIVRGHRYALLGRNGVGKSTLLKQLEAGSIPGMPRGMVIRIVKQQVDGRNDQTSLASLVEADEYRTALLKEEYRVEKELDGGIDLERNAQRIGDISAELLAIDAENAEERALTMLKGLSFTEAMIHGPTINLSGGWRMRLALAQALFTPYSDLLLLDECTNHLDLQGMAWLEKFLTTEQIGNPLTLICVSHDRSFLDNVCTDVIVMEHKRLTYHVGNYSDYQQKMQEKRARECQILDASERQRAKALTFVEKQQQESKKSSDPNKQRQAKMIKDKKLDRIGNYREDGKRFKLNSLKKLSEEFVRLPQKVSVEIDESVVKLRFPDPVWPPSITEGSPLVQMKDVNFSYNFSKTKTNGKNDSPLLLCNLTLDITQNTKAAIVGANGCGKTTLCNLLVGDINTRVRGTIWRHPTIRIGHITQYSVEEMNKFSHLTLLQYAKENLSGDALSAAIAKASGNVRQYLGAFGLGGSHATRLISALSGGERMRLCFATALANAPHLLLLDESSNHIDMETLDSLSAALRAFRGAVVVVSHNQSFLSGFCNELWSFSENETGKVNISHDDAESFDELFSRYRERIFSSSVSACVVKERHSMAKKSAKQSANASRSAALL
jgi:ATP-binding cassette subfamily F protein 3